MRSPSTARRCVRSPTSRSSWCKISPPRPSSPSRTPGCSTSCAESAAAADRHRRRAQGHQPLDLRPADGARYAGQSRPSGCARRIRLSSVGVRANLIRLPQPTASRRNQRDHREPLSRPKPGRGSIFGRRWWKAAPSTFRMSWPIRNSCSSARESWRPPAYALRSACRSCAKGTICRRPHGAYAGAAALHRKADRAGRDLRRPGGDRDRERAAVRRGAGAHARTLRGAGAADGDLGGAQGHQQLARRAGARVPGHAGERDAHLRGQVRNAQSLRRRGIPYRRAARRTARICRDPAATPHSVRTRDSGLGSASPGRSRWCTSTTFGRASHTSRAIQLPSPSPNSAALVPSSSCRCSRTTS